ncbi:MAG: spore maturation protein A [Clostridia bacterium]|nr:spore maturation protein A [Clostridia bacterium]
MLNKLWCFFILIAIIFSLIVGSYESVNNAIFNSIENTKNLILALFFNICFWSGIINIIKNTTLIDKIKRILKPFLKFIFPKLDDKSEVFEDISMNVVSNLLGLGNASTPAGLKAMEGLQDKNSNKEKLSNEMLLFILINTASIQLIPTNIIGIRMGLNSENPTGIIFGVWISSLITFSFIILFTKIYIRCFRK